MKTTANSGANETLAPALSKRGFTGLWADPTLASKLLIGPSPEIVEKVFMCKLTILQGGLR